MAIADTARLIASLDLKGNFNAQIRASEKALGGFESRLDRTQSRAYKFGAQIGTGIKNIGRAAVVAATAVAGVSIASLRVAGDFEAQLNTINTIAHKTPAELKGIGDQVRSIAKATGTPLEELTQGYYDLLSAGIKAADAQKVLTASNQLAIGGLASTAETVDLLTTAINTYGGDASKAAQDADIFAKAIERGKVTAADLAASFANVGPVAAAAGIDLKELGAAYAQLTATGIPAAEAATDVRSAILSLQKTTPALEKLEKQTHKNYLSIASKQGLVAALEQMRLDAKKSGVPVTDLLGRVEALNFFLATTGPNFAAYQDNLKAMGDASGTAASQMAERQKGLNFQLARLKALAKDTGITIGEALLPKITPLVAKFNEFVSGKDFQAGIKQFGDAVAGLFTDSNVQSGIDAIKTGFETAKAAAPVIQGAAKATLGLVQAAVSVFKSLPGPLQGLAVGAFAINKLTGGLVTNVAGGIFGQIKDFFIKQRGTTPANPLFVADVTKGIGGAIGALGGAGAAGGVGLFGGAGLPLAVIAASIIGPLIAQQKISSDNSDLAKSVGAAVNKQIAGGATLKDLQTSLAAVNTGINEIQSNPLNVLVAGDALDQLKAQRKTLETALYFQTHPVAAGNATPKTFIGSDQFPGKEKDDKAIVKATLALISNEFKNITNALKTSNKASEIKNAIKEALDLTGKGRGNADATKGIVAGLKTALKNTHDPKLQSELRAAIRKVEAKLPAREFAARQLSKADAILRSNERSGQKINDLKAIERALKDRGLPHAADRIREKIDQAKREQVYAQHAATQAIKDKDLSVSLRNNITNNITIRSIINGTTLVSSYGHTLSTKGGLVAS